MNNDFKTITPSSCCKVFSKFACQAPVCFPCRFDQAFPESNIVNNIAVYPGKTPTNISENLRALETGN